VFFSSISVASPSYVAEGRAFRARRSVVKTHTIGTKVGMWTGRTRLMRISLTPYLRSSMRISTRALGKSNMRVENADEEEAFLSENVWSSIAARLFRIPGISRIPPV